MGDEKDKNDSGVDFSKSGKRRHRKSRRTWKIVTNAPSSFFSTFFARLASPIARLDHLEHLIINTNSNKLKDLQTSTSAITTTTNDTFSRILSVESLLDCLIVLFDECQNSSLRREKTVSEFLELRKYSTTFVQGLCLNCA